MLKVLDQWGWPEPEESDECVHDLYQNMRTTYLNGISAVASHWRGVRNPNRILRKAESIFPKEIAIEFFDQVPGTCHRGRWISVESVGISFSPGDLLDRGSLRGNMGS